MTEDYRTRALAEARAKQREAWARTVPGRATEASEDYEFWGSKVAYLVAAAAESR